LNADFFSIIFSKFDVFFGEKWLFCNVYCKIVSHCQDFFGLSEFHVLNNNMHII